MNGFAAGGVLGAMTDADRTLETVHARHAGSLFGYLCGLLSDASAAEDVLQEVFLKGLGQASPADRPAAWWFAVARNAALNHLRDRGRKRETSLEAAGPDADPGPLTALARREDVGRVATALAALDDEKREAVELHYGHGLTYVEVARILGIPEGTVKSRCHHGLRALRRTLRVH